MVLSYNYLLEEEGLLKTQNPLVGRRERLWSACVSSAEYHFHNVGDKSFD